MAIEILKLLSVFGLYFVVVAGGIATVRAIERRRRRIEGERK